MQLKNSANLSGQANIMRSYTGGFQCQDDSYGIMG